MLRVPRSLRRSLLTAACSGSLLLTSGTAFAQERDPAAAQGLFDQAKELTRQGKFAEACPKLQESNRLDPGIGTQFHLADCYEQSGRVASAWALFLDVASQARAGGQLDREKAAQKRAEKLQPRLPKLIVTVPEASKASGLEIRRNGVVVGSAQWGAAVPVDPGEVELTSSAPGKQTVRQSLRLEEGKTATYSVPTLAVDTSAPVASAGDDPTGLGAAPAPAAVAAPSPAPQPAPPSDEPAARSSGNTGWVLTLGGLGIVGLGVGATYAILAKGEYDDSKAEDKCSPTNVNRCNAEGVALRNSAITKGNVATIASIAGGVALAAAGVVWLASGSSEPKKTARLSAAPVVGPDQASLYVQGSF